ncbi:ImuA family protein [Pedobacter sp. GR22-6]|uniref:ImuA family protein n=1 Tax=Pedobacter sp. GR22-6 TaxID=3127957 RepID=UPI00307D92AF
MEAKSEILDKLKRNLLLWQGFKPAELARAEQIGLGEIEDAFPAKVFPRKAIHEFICLSPDQASATDGFIAGLLSVLMADGAACVWVGTRRRLFPSALAAFNVAADRIIFIDLQSEQEVLWVMEEALKCEGLAAVVAEVDGLSLVNSRRLQLAVEQHGIPGLIIRKDERRMASTVSTARWRIAPLPSQDEEGLPGVGFPRWQVQLLKVRSGQPGSWILEWQGDGFAQLPASAHQITAQPLEKIG